MMRAVLDPSREGLRLDRAIAESQIVIARLPKCLIGNTNTALLGYLLISRLWTAALSQGNTAPDDRKAFNVYIDEFGSFTTSALEIMLAEARKFGLSFVLAHQFHQQLRPAVAAAVEGNVANRIVFRLGAADATQLAPRLGADLDEIDLANLPNHTAVASLLVDGAPATPFTLHTRPPASWLGHAS
jgi:hypothetical protein